MEESFPAIAAADAAGRTIEVLHVDDDPDLATVTAEWLERANDRITVETVTSGRAALERLSGNGIDCIVSDYDMPGMTGLELLDEVRKSEPDLPFVLFTGKGSEEVASEAISRGVTEYMQKGAGTDQYHVLANRVENAVSRHRSERTVERTREWFQTLIEESGDVVLVVDETATITYASPAATEVLGRTPEQLRGTSGFDPVDPDYRERVARKFAALVENPEVRQCVEFPYHRPDGSTIRVEVRGRNLLDHPVVGGIVVYTRDVTERKEREEILESLYETTPALLGATTETELCETAVEAAERILELPLTGIHRYDPGRDALVPVVTTDRVPEVLGSEPVYERGDTLVWRAFETGEPQVVEDAATFEGDLPDPETPIRSGIVYPLGDLGVFITSSTDPGAFDDRDLHFVRLVATHVEVGLERLHSEALLDRERDRLAALFENVPDPINRVSFGEDGTTVEAVNPAFESVFGYDAAEVVGSDPASLHVPDDAAREGERIDQRVRDGEVVEREVTRETADGRREFLFRGIPIERDAPNDEAFGVYVDVTDARRRQRELQRQNERLDRFASIVGHDLRNPLEVASGRLELLAEECEGGREHAAAIARAHDRMAALLDDLGALAHDDVRVLDAEPVDLEAVATDCWPGGSDGEDRLVVAGSQSLRADRHRLGRLLANLFENAVVHAGEDVRVEVGLLDEDDGFYVADDGPGIPPEDREDVFEFGYSTAEEGTGFGLAIVAEIADSHGWTVAVTDAEAGGARVEVRGVEWAGSDGAAPE